MRPSTNLTKGTFRNSLPLGRSLRSPGFYVLLGAALISVPQSVWSQVPQNFVATTPCRIVDTRKIVGAFGGPMLLAGESRTYPIRSGPCKIPASASAYALTVTAIPNASLESLTLWPSDQAKPEIPTLTSDSGRISAHSVIVSAGTDANGSINVYVSDHADLMLDIRGYFVPAEGKNTSQSAEIENQAGETEKPVKESTAFQSATGGAGLTNYVPLWLNSTTLGDSAIFQLNRQVGIGTINPTSKLDVSGKLKVEGNPSIGSDAPLFVSAPWLATAPTILMANQNPPEGGVGVTLQGTSGGGSEALGQISFGGYGSAGSGGGLDLATSQDGKTYSSRLRITNSGNTGIGTLNPTSKLDVSGKLKVEGNPSIGSDAPLFVSAPWLANAPTILMANQNPPEGGVGVTLQGTSGGGSEALGQISFGGYGSTGSGGGLDLATSQDGKSYASRLRITNDGRVGIGTSSPAAALDVTGPVKVGGQGAGIVFSDGSFQTTAAQTLKIVAGAGISVTQVGNTITISSTGSGSPPGGSTGTLTVNVQNVSGSGFVTASGSDGTSYKCGTGLPSKIVSCSYSYSQGTVVNFTMTPTSPSGYSSGNCPPVTTGPSPQSCSVNFYLF